MEIYSTTLWHLQKDVALSALSKDLTDMDKNCPEVRALRHPGSVFGPRCRPETFCRDPAAQSAVCSRPAVLVQSPSTCLPVCRPGV